MKNKKIKRGFLKENKKGVSNILAVILIILIVLMMLVILWNIIKSLITTQSEISMIKAKLIGVDIGIEDVGGDLLTPKQVNLTIHRGPGKIIVKNVSIIEYYADIVFIIDSTGSMGDEIDDVKNTINGFVNKLEEKNLNYRLALIEFKDYPISPCGGANDFPSKIYGFLTGHWTKNVTEFSESLDQIEYSGGMNSPESHLTAIKNASEDLIYGNQETLKKIVILLTDNVPHAVDCSYLEGDSDGECNLGPNNIQDLINSLVNNNNYFYYINKISGLCDNQMMIKMVNETGGKFYDYDEDEGVEEIILDLTTKIIKTYGLEDYDHLKIMFYNDSDQYEYRLYDMPFPLETKTYVIPNITLEGFELSDKITNITRIEIYQVVTTLSGEPIIGPLLDSWKIG